MDVREKLVELLSGGCCPDDGCDFCTYAKFEGCRPHVLADHLIANGVTVQEWISVEDRLPTSDTIVLVFVRGYVEIGWYDGNHDEWRTGIVTLDNCEVTHWMPLPHPPKGNG